MDTFRGGNLAEEEIRRSSIRVLRPAERERDESGERFVGRERELAQLSGALDKAVAGHGRMFMVSGEPGIGKTRLADEISARARSRGLRVIWGRCWEGGGAPAFWPIIQIIRKCAERPDFAQLTEALGPGVEQVAALVPELVRPAPVQGERAGLQRIDPEQARFRLFDAVATLLRSVAQREPLIIVIDDLHDANLATLQMVRFLARALRDSPILLIGTHREAEVERSPELRSVFADLGRESDQLPLRGLSLADTAGLIRNHIYTAPDERFLTMLHQTTEGNPLFLSGVLQMLAAEGKLEHQERLSAGDLNLPANVRGAIERSLSGLSKRTGTLLSIAAVQGIEFDPALLEHVAGVSAKQLLDCLDDAASSGLVAIAPESRGHYRFTHALTRLVIYDGIASAARVRLHLRIAEALEESHATDLRPRLEEIAYHFRETHAEGAEKAIEYTIKAADAARGVFAFEQAAELYQLAVEMMERYGTAADRRAELFELAANVVGEARGDKTLTLRYQEGALELYEKLGQTEKCAGIHIALGIDYTIQPLADIPRALEHLRKAEAVLGEGPDSVPLAFFNLGMAMALEKELRLEEALLYARRVMEMGKRLGNESIELHGAIEYAAHLVHCGRTTEGLNLAESSWNRADRLDNETTGFATATINSLLYIEMADPIHGARIARQELSRPRLAHHISNLSHLRGCLCGLLLKAGQLAEAHQLCPEECPEDPGTASDFALYRGDWKRAARLQSDEVEKYTRAGDRAFAAMHLHFLAQVSWLLGERTAAVKFLTDALPAKNEVSHQVMEMMYRPDLAFFQTAMGNLGDASLQLARCREIMAAGEDWRGLGASVARAEGRLSAAKGQMVEASSHFRAAIEIARRYCLPFVEAETEHSWGNALLESADAAGASEKFDAAIEIYQRIEAGQAWIDRVMADRERGAATPQTAESERATDRTARNLFHQQGDYWAISFDGAEFNLKDAKGLHYIARLLVNPGEQISAIDLAALASGEASGTQRTVDLGDAGEVLDAKARAEYKRRLDELREEIERLRLMNDIGATERAEAEYEALSRQLIAAAGLGGHIRRSASHRERARVAVTKSIKTAIEGIRACNPSLGRHLSKAIRTGHFCSYEPSEKLSWQF